MTKKAATQLTLSFLTALLSGDVETAKNLADDDFKFVFKGRTHISNLVQDKEGFFGN